MTADRILMDKMRAQIESLTAALARSQDTNRSLETAVRRREHELGKELQKVTSRSLEGGIHESEGKMEMLVMADSANARIIDQLNGQVDFLNDQLATREAQLASLSEKLLGAQELRLECDNRGKLLDASREENAMLIAELRELEDKVPFLPLLLTLYFLKLTYIAGDMLRSRSSTTIQIQRGACPSNP